jgi:uncharacterized protein (TIGR01777 family)
MSEAPGIKQIVITGSTGFIGQALSAHLLSRGFRVMGLSRHPERRRPELIPGADEERWNPEKLDGWERILKHSDAILNLAGAGIGPKPWTKRIKHQILNSRLQASRILVQALKKIDTKPQLFVQISGTGYYGSRDQESLDEHSTGGRGFLAKVSREWEAATLDLEQMGIRRVICRTGMVLGPNGGVLKRLLLPFRLFLGGTIGTGDQWMSWIHRTDVCRAFEFLVSRPKLEGIFNLSTPKPVTNREWTQTISKTMKKPAFLHIPAWSVKTFLGEMGEELLLASQRVFPGRLLEAGFKFRFPDLESGLRDILS